MSCQLEDEQGSGIPDEQPNSTVRSCGLKLAEKQNLRGMEKGIQEMINKSQQQHSADKVIHQTWSNDIPYL